MASLKTILFTLGIVSSLLIQTQGADKYTDGNRPYEFGFNIEGEQHRHEQKDEKGLIMGEFGFITADGVYHVTVYATDEQGRFKILSMKNIRVKPYPTYKRPEAGSARQGHSLDVQTPQQTLLNGPSPVQKSKTAVKEISIEPPGRSCSSCSLPTTTTQAPAQEFVQPNVQNTPLRSEGNHFGQNPASVNQHYPQGATNSFGNQQNSFTDQSGGSPPSFRGNQENSYNNPQTHYQQGPSPQNAFTKQGLGLPKQDSANYYPSEPQSVQPQEFGRDGQSGRVGSTSGRTAKKYDGPVKPFGSEGAQPNGIPNGEAGFNQGQALPNKPTLISAQMQIVDKNTDIHRRGPGEKEGLPNGLTKSDMTQLLYTFNYTVGFHGHFEEGYRNGAKQGYYYITGRNGVRTRVDYVADENGFRPKITQEVLDLLSDDVPKPETEKDEKYGLKGYEFKWLYFPVE